MNNTEYIEKVDFQLCTAPDSEGLILEVLDNNEDAILEIRIDSNNTQWVRFFSSDKHIALTLDDMQKAIEIAKKDVINEAED